jgi:3-oxoacyl-[acyl-carrier-protein] synthase II
MMLAMKDAGVEPSQVAYVNAHGTSTHHNDLFETRAIKLAFGDAAKNLYVNSTKSMIGHLLGAAGAVECIVCAKSVMEDYIHPTVNSKEADEECDLNYVFGKGVHTEVEYALSNSLGFGGHNASLLIAKYRE